MTPQPIKNLDALAQNPDMWKRRESFSSMTGFNPLIYGNDVDSVDVATRVAMVIYYIYLHSLCVLLFYDFTDCLKIVFKKKGFSYHATKLVLASKTLNATL